MIDNKTGKYDESTLFPTAVKTSTANRKCNTSSIGCQIPRPSAQNQTHFLTHKNVRRADLAKTVPGPDSGACNIFRARHNRRAALGFSVVCVQNPRHMGAEPFKGWVLDSECFLFCKNINYDFAKRNVPGLDSCACKISRALCGHRALPGPSIVVVCKNTR